MAGGQERRIGAAPSGNPGTEATVLQSSQTATTALSRLGSRLASPLGVMISIPALVAVVGLLLTLVGQRSLRASNLAAGEDRFAEQSKFIGDTLAYSLRQSDALLDRVNEVARLHPPSAPAAAALFALRDLMTARAGVAYLSISYPDGTFRGVYVDDDGKLRCQESRVGVDGTTQQRWDFASDGSLALRLSERTSYDPRQRGFYRTAAAAGRRTWTAPYAFFATHYTGITRTEPLFDAERRLIAVTTVDFDVNALSHYLGELPFPGARTLVYASDGTLLAYPAGTERLRALQLVDDKPLQWRALGDPLLESFFSDPSRSTAPDGARSARFEVGGETQLVTVAPVGGSTGLDWYVAAIVPEASFYRALRRHQLLSATASAFALVGAVVLAALLARHVLRLRRDTAQAREAARTAAARAQELGSYRLVERLGEGGMGEVWRAEHRLLVRDAAIKLIHPEALGNAEIGVELRERFKREAQTLASLRSLHTTQLFDYGVTEDGTFFCVMELLDGMNLETLVDRHGPQPPARVVAILEQACRSLAEAHDAGLVHRDIKPANLFLCRAADEVDLVKVLDFGLVQPPVQSVLEGASSATASAKLTSDGRFLGTPTCMAPEQALGETVDRRADLYALGVVAYFLLTARLPFEDDNPVVLMLAHVQREPPRPSEHVTTPLPDGLEAIVLDCLAKSRDARPKDARELARRLREVVIPASDAWTEARKAAWWAEHRPPDPRLSVSLGPGGIPARRFAVTG